MAFIRIPTRVSSFRAQRFMFRVLGFPGFGFRGLGFCFQKSTGNIAFRGFGSFRKGKTVSGDEGLRGFRYYLEGSQSA